MGLLNHRTEIQKIVHNRRDLSNAQYRAGCVVTHRLLLMIKLLVCVIDKSQHQIFVRHLERHELANYYIIWCIRDDSLQ